MTRVFTLPKTVVLIGMMGAGKTSIGKRFAKRLGVRFSDSDHEVEAAAGCTIADIYATYGEGAFRDAEKRVIKRLLGEPPHILSTGGGAFINEEIRAEIQNNAISVWIKADMETLLPRISRRSHRPQFTEGSQEKTLAELMRKYYPAYAEADIVIDCANASPDETVTLIMEKVERYIYHGERRSTASNDE